MDPTSPTVSTSLIPAPITDYLCKSKYHSAQWMFTLVEFLRTACSNSDSCSVLVVKSNRNTFECVISFQPFGIAPYSGPHLQKSGWTYVEYGRFCLATSSPTTDCDRWKDIDANSKQLTLYDNGVHMVSIAWHIRCLWPHSSMIESVCNVP